MERIGIAASKMAQGNLLKYNVFVVLISCIFSLFIFFICGFSLVVVLFLISLLFNVLLPGGSHAALVHIGKIVLIILSVLIAILNALAIVKNIKIAKN